MKRTIFILLFVVASMFSKAATCTATASGNWETSGTWSCGRVPTCGDSIVIPAGITVTITTVLNYSGCGPAIQINIFGILQFQTGKKLNLACGSIVYVQTGGRILPGSGGGSSNLIDICGVDLWTAGYGTVNGPVIIICCSPLPIELISFSATPQNNFISLTWVTATETNNDFFSIEKSKDGFSFELVGTIKGAGNSTANKYYSFADEAPYDGTSYYRLKQTDFDGRYTYSTIVAVEFNTVSNWGFILKPNPSNGDQINIVFSTSVNESQLKLTITDLVGKIVFNKLISISDSHEEIIRPDTPLSPGAYLINASSLSHSFTTKLIVE